MRQRQIVHIKCHPHIHSSAVMLRSVSRHAYMHTSTYIHAPTRSHGQRSCCAMKVHTSSTCNTGHPEEQQKPQATPERRGVLGLSARASCRQIARGILLPHVIRRDEAEKRLTPL